MHVLHDILLNSPVSNFTFPPYSHLFHPLFWLSYHCPRALLVSRSFYFILVAYATVLLYPAYYRLVEFQTSSTRADQGSSALGGDNPDPCTSRSTSANNRSRSSNNHGSRSSTRCHGETSDTNKHDGGSGMDTSGGGGEVEASAALLAQVHLGRTFEKLGSAEETWDNAVASLLAAFRLEGHNCLMRRNKKKVRPITEQQSVGPGRVPAHSKTAMARHPLR